MELLHILSTAVNAVIPIVLLIALGYWLRKTGFFKEQFVSTASKFVFRVCLPCLLFVNIYSIGGFSEIGWDVVIYVLLVVCLLFVMGLLTVLFTTKDPKRKGVILQSVFRSNFAFIGFPLASVLGGSGALAVAAVVSAFSIPLFNVFAVLSLTMFVDKGEDGKTNFRRIINSIAKNPIILGCLFGLLCLGIRELQNGIFGETVFSLERDLRFIHTAADNLGAIASPLALVVLGAQFEFSAVRGMLKEIFVGTVWRIVLAPIIGIGMAVLLAKYTNLISCGVNEYPMLIALFGSPTAVSSAIMAGEMGNDEQLATQIVVWTSIGSIVTIFVTVCVMMAAGLVVV